MTDKITLGGKVIPIIFGLFERQAEAASRMGPLKCSYCRHTMRREQGAGYLYRCDNCKMSVDLVQIARLIHASAHPDMQRRALSEPRERRERWRLTDEGLEWLRTAPYDELVRVLAVRTANGIENARQNDQLHSRDLTHLLRLKNFGRKSLAELLAFLKTQQGLIYDTFEQCPHCGRGLRDGT